MKNEVNHTDAVDRVWTRPMVGTGDLIAIKRISPNDPEVSWEEAMGIVRSYEWDGFDDCGWVCLLNAEGYITHHALEHPYVLIEVEVLEPAPSDMQSMRCTCDMAYKSWVKL
jgi:hypothetical protein